MKTLAFNGSPKTDKGNTSMILTPFLRGMEQAGSEVELFFTKRLHIKPCQGEVNCWFKHPGRCWQDDDMNMLLPRIREADILVFASPVYCDGVTGPLKTLIDRFLPIAATSYTLRNDRMRLGIPDNLPPKRVVLASTCGFWEMETFDPLLFHMKAFCENLDAEFAGALLRPHANMLQAMVDAGAPIEDVFTAAEEAGRQLVSEGRMTAQTLEVVRRELLPRDQYIDQLNAWVTQTQDEIKVS
jgi:multimeric flavodoxin WrbA